MPNATAAKLCLPRSRQVARRDRPSVAGGHTERVRLQAQLWRGIAAFRFPSPGYAAVLLGADRAGGVRPVSGRPCAHRRRPPGPGLRQATHLGQVPQAEPQPSRWPSLVTAPHSGQTRWA